MLWLMQSTQIVGLTRTADLRGWRELNFERLSSFTLTKPQSG